MKALKPIAPRAARSAMRPRLPGTIPPHSPKSVTEAASRAARFSSNSLGPTVHGEELSGMSKKVAPPPAASAWLPVAAPSHSARPGWLKCTWTSISPGSTVRPRASISSPLPGNSRAISTMRPSSTARSAAMTPSGVTTEPPRTITRASSFPEIRFPRREPHLHRRPTPLREEPPDPRSSRRRLRLLLPPELGQQALRQRQAIGRRAAMIADGVQGVRQNLLRSLHGGFIPLGAQERVLGFGGAQGNGRHSAIGQAGAANAASGVEIDGETGGHGADVVHAALGGFVEPDEGGKRLREDDGDQQFAGGERGLAIAEEKFVERQGAETVRAGDPDLG